MSAEDQNGNPATEYPLFHQGARFLGINADGIAEYYTGDEVFFALMTDAGEINAPPANYGPAHELSLEAYDWSLREYLRRTFNERGEFRTLSEFARASMGGNTEDG